MTPPDDSAFENDVTAVSPYDDGTGHHRAAGQEQSAVAPSTSTSGRSAGWGWFNRSRHREEHPAADSVPPAGPTASSDGAWGPASQPGVAPSGSDRPSESGSSDSAWSSPESAATEVGWPSSSPATGGEVGSGEVVAADEPRSAEPAPASADPGEAVRPQDDPGPVASPALPSPTDQGGPGPGSSEALNADPARSEWSAPQTPDADSRPGSAEKVSPIAPETPHVAASESADGEGPFADRSPFESTPATDRTGTASAPDSDASSPPVTPPSPWAVESPDRSGAAETAPDQVSARPAGDAEAVETPHPAETAPPPGAAPPSLSDAGDAEAGSAERPESAAPGETFSPQANRTSTAEGPAANPTTGSPAPEVESAVSSEADASSRRAESAPDTAREVVPVPGSGPVSEQVTVAPESASTETGPAGIEQEPAAPEPAAAPESAQVASPAAPAPASATSEPSRPLTRAEIRRRREAESAANPPAESPEGGEPSSQEPSGRGDEPEEEPTHEAIDALAEAADTLQDEGYYVVVAQRWPGARNAWVELLLVGTGGIFVMAATNWRTLRLRDGELDGNVGDIDRAARSLSNIAAKVEAELITIGVAPGEVVPVGVTESPAQGRAEGAHHGRIRVVAPDGVMPLIRSRGRRFRQSHVDRIAAVLAGMFPEQLERATAAARAEVEPDPAGELTDVEPWMTFLTPEQAALAHRDWSGPARIRGAAGTGKTVLGLHRAAYLALTTPDRVLVASLVRTLPKVMERSYAQLSPETRDRVEFTSVHRFALDVLTERGVRTQVDLAAASAAFRTAWDRAGNGTILSDQPVPMSYWQEEIEHIIKGRGLVTREQYLAAERHGRRHPAKPQVRTQVWALLNAYQSELASRGVMDLADVLLLADGELAREPWPVKYSGVIIDEAQDASVVAVRLLHRLVGDRPNGLLLIADGQQGVVPGGLRLDEAGVSVTGRDALLSRNMRNDQLLGQVAHAVVSATTFDDLDGFVWHPDRGLSWAHEGGQMPTIVREADPVRHDAALLQWLRSISQADAGPPDVAVLVARQNQADHYRQLLTEGGLAAVDLDRYDGSQRAVKVGTMRRAKGLTFANVAIAQLHGDSLENTTLTRPDLDSGVAAALERIEREQREVFSAISRVTHSLWLGYLEPR